MSDCAVPVRLQLSRQKGFKLQAFSRATNGLEAVNVARRSRWGNPYKIGDLLQLETGQRVEVATRLHAQTLYRDNVVKFNLEIAAYSKTRATPGEGGIAAQKWVADLLALRGKNLACWCPAGERCHADLLLKLANKEKLASMLLGLAKK